MNAMYSVEETADESPTAPCGGQVPCESSSEPREPSLLTLNEVCGQLSISTATGRNWLRLGKLIPEEANGASARFTQAYVDALKRALQSGSNGPLKRRRNKTKVVGATLYKDYIDADSPNYPVIGQLLDTITHTPSLLGGVHLILAEIALQLLRQAGKIEGAGSGSLLRRYVDGQLDTGRYRPLLENLIQDGRADDVLYGVLDGVTIAFRGGEDVLGFAYLSLMCLSSRKTTGAYYTPKKTVDKMASQLLALRPGKQATILDPCCGSGNFLIALLEWGVAPQQLHGRDIDGLSVRLARLNAAIFSDVRDVGVLYANIVHGDALTDDSGNAGARYDIIIGNPPWGVRYSGKALLALSGKYVCARAKTAESYDLFIESALGSLTDGGHLLYILPEAVLNVKGHQPVREIILREAQIKSVEYLGDIFHKVQCPSVILLLEKCSAAFATSGIAVRTAESHFVIDSERTLDPSCFSLNIKNADYRIIQTLERGSDKAYLAGNADFAIGIVTGNNRAYIRTTPSDGYEPVVRGADIEPYRIRSIRSYIRFEPEKFQQVADSRYYRAPEKLLYRFISGRLVFAYDDRQTLSLNSCNILIPRIPGLSARYVLALLNSSVAQFYFARKFNSVKVLRSHIEQIPLVAADANVQRRIGEKTARLLTPCDGEAALCRELDREIGRLYGLTEDEYAQVAASLPGPAAASVRQ